MKEIIADLDILESFTYGSQAYPVAQRVKKAIAALQLVEGQKPPTNIDYAAALRKCIEGWMHDQGIGEYIDAHGTLELMQRLNAIKAAHCKKGIL